MKAIQGYDCDPVSLGFIQKLLHRDATDNLVICITTSNIIQFAFIFEYHHHPFGRDGQWWGLVGMLVDPWGPIATYIPTSRTTSILSSLWWGSSCWLWPSWLTSKFPPPRLVLSPIGIGLCLQTFTKSPQDLHQYNPFMMIMMLIMMMILQILSGPASIQFSQTTPWKNWTIHTDTQFTLSPSLPRQLQNYRKLFVFGLKKIICAVKI